jgi:ribosomal protein S18 acetylase RimI-like enzyme
MNEEALEAAVRAEGFENVPQARFTVRMAKGLQLREGYHQWSRPGGSRNWALEELGRWNKPPRDRVGLKEGINVVAPSGRGAVLDGGYSHTILYRVEGRAVGVLQKQGVAIKTVAVHPDYQGRGIGRQMAEAARRLGAVYSDGPFSPSGYPWAKRFNEETVAQMSPALVRVLLE